MAGEEEEEWLWVPHKDLAFVAARLISESNGQARVQTEQHEELIVPFSDCFPLSDRSEIHAGIADLVQLSDVNPASILHTLRFRFERDQIYTALGPILVSINPFKWLPGLYSDESMRRYSSLNDGVFPASNSADPGANSQASTSGTASTGVDSVNGEPHVFAVMNKAYKGVVSKMSQAVIISGESGAGKTEATKSCLRYLAYLAGSGHSVETKVLQTSPILEAFGNAKTLRNNNSSRFGKFIRINFDHDSKILGCSNACYLLEKSRIVHQIAGERNYHVFYQLLRGATGDLRTKLGLVQAGTDVEAQFRFLCGGAGMEIEQVDDAAEFQVTVEGLTTLDFTNEDQNNVWEMLAGIMHMGNTTLRTDPSDDSRSVVDSDATLAVAATMLGVNQHTLKDILVSRVVQSGRRRSMLVVPLNLAEAIEMREAIAKDIYSRLFEWLVSRINTAINTLQQQQRTEESTLTELGILDIFGFEVFQNNSFEQLCINFANERLHRVFNQHVFQTELDLYQQEQIVVPAIEWKDNQDLIELLTQKPQGLFVLLDEEGRVPKGSWQGLLRKFTRAHETSPRLQYRPGSDTFTVVHYAGPVTYDPSAMLVKNKDTISDSALQALADSSNPIIRSLFQDATETQAAREQPTRAAGASPRKSMSTTEARKATIATQFSNQLDELVAVLNASHPHFIRCIKSNSIKKPGYLEAALCFEQLSYSGIFEAVLISQQGYPFRVPHLEFRRRFHMLAAGARQSLAFEGSTAEQCRWIIAQFSAMEASLPNAFHVGRTMVFYRVEQSRIIERTRRMVCNAAGLTVTKVLRGYAVHAKFQRVRALQEEIFNLLVGQAQAKQVELVVTRLQKDVVVAEKVYNARFSKEEIDSAVKYIRATTAILEFQEKMQTLLAAPPFEVVDAMQTELAAAQALTTTIAIRESILELGVTTTEPYIAATKLVERVTKMAAVDKLLTRGLTNEEDQPLREALATIDEISQMENVKGGWFDATRANQARQLLKAIDDELQVLLPELQQALVDGQITATDMGEERVAVRAEVDAIDHCLKRFENSPFQTKKIKRVADAARRLRVVRLACNNGDVEAATAAARWFRWCAPWTKLLDLDVSEPDVPLDTTGQSQEEWEADSNMHAVFAAELTQCGKWLLHELYFHRLCDRVIEISSTRPLAAEKEPQSLFAQTATTVEGLLTQRKYLSSALRDIAVTLQAMITFRRAIFAADLPALDRALVGAEGLSDSPRFTQEYQFAKHAQQYLTASIALRQQLVRELQAQIHEDSGDFTSNLPALTASLSAAASVPPIHDGERMSRLLQTCRATLSAAHALQQNNLEDAAGAVDAVDLASLSTEPVIAELLAEFKNALHIRRLKYRLVQSMTEGRVRGVVGNLDLSDISTANLVRAIEQAEPIPPSDDHVQCAQLVLKCRTSVMNDDWAELGRVLATTEPLTWLECCRSELQLLQMHHFDREVCLRLTEALKFHPYFSSSGAVMQEHLQLVRLHECIADLSGTSALSPKTESVLHLAECILQLRTSIQRELWETPEPSPTSELLRSACTADLHQSQKRLQVLQNRDSNGPGEASTVCRKIRDIQLLTSARLCEGELAAVQEQLQLRRSILQACVALRTAVVTGSVESFVVDTTAVEELAEALSSLQLLPPRLIAEPSITDLIQLASSIREVRLAMQCEEYHFISSSELTKCRTMLHGVVGDEISLVGDLVEDFSRRKELIEAIAASRVILQHDNLTVIGDVTPLKFACSRHSSQAMQASAEVHAWAAIANCVIEYRSRAASLTNPTPAQISSNDFASILFQLEDHIASHRVDHTLISTLRTEVQTIRHYVAHMEVRQSQSEIIKHPLRVAGDTFITMRQWCAHSELGSLLAAESMIATTTFLEAVIQVLQQIYLLIEGSDPAHEHGVSQEISTLLEPTRFLSRWRLLPASTSDGDNEQLSLLLAHWLDIQRSCLDADQSLLSSECQQFCHQLLRYSCEWQFILQLCSSLPSQLGCNEQDHSWEATASRILQAAATYEAFLEGLQSDISDADWRQSPTHDVYTSALRLACLLHALSANRYHAADRDWRHAIEPCYIRDTQDAMVVSSAITVQQVLAGTVALGQSPQPAFPIHEAVLPLFCDAVRIVEDAVAEYEIRRALVHEAFRCDLPIQCEDLDAALRRVAQVGVSSDYTMKLADDAALVLQLKKLTQSDRFEAAIQVLHEMTECSDVNELPRAVEEAVMQRCLDTRAELLRVAIFVLDRHWRVNCLKTAEPAFVVRHTAAPVNRQDDILLRLQNVIHDGHTLHVLLAQSGRLLEHVNHWSLLRNLQADGADQSRAHFLHTAAVQFLLESFDHADNLGLPKHTREVIEQFDCHTRTEQLIHLATKFAKRQLINFDTNGVAVDKVAVTTLQQILTKLRANTLDAGVRELGNSFDKVYSDGTRLLTFIEDYTAFMSGIVLPIYWEPGYIARIQAVDLESYLERVQFIRTIARQDQALCTWAGLQESINAALEFGNEVRLVQQLLQLGLEFEKGQCVQDDVLHTGQQLARLYPKTLCAQKLADACQQLWQAFVAVRENRWQEVELNTYAWRWPQALNRMSRTLYANSIARWLQRQFEAWCCRLPAPLSLGWSVLTSQQLQTTSLPVGLLCDLSHRYDDLPLQTPAVIEMFDIIKQWTKLVASFSMCAGINVVNWSSNSHDEHSTDKPTVGAISPLISEFQSLLGNCKHLSAHAIGALNAVSASMERELELKAALTRLSVSECLPVRTQLAHLMKEAPATTGHISSLVQLLEAYLVQEHLLSIDECSTKHLTLERLLTVVLPGSRQDNGHPTPTQSVHLSSAQLLLLQDSPYQSYLSGTFDRESQRPWSVAQCTGQDFLLKFCPELVQELVKLQAQHVFQSVVAQFEALAGEQQGSSSFELLRTIFAEASEAHVEQWNGGEGLVQILEVCWMATLGTMQSPSDETRQAMTNVQQRLQQFANAKEETLAPVQLEGMSCEHVSGQLVRRSARTLGFLWQELDYRGRRQQLDQLLDLRVFSEAPELCSISMGGFQLLGDAHGLVITDVPERSTHLRLTLQTFVHTMQLAEEGKWLQMLEFLQTVDTATIESTAHQQLKLAERFALNMLCREGIAEALQIVLQSANRTEQVRVLAEVLKKYELNFEYWTSAQTVLLWQSAESLYLVLRSVWLSELAGCIDTAENVLQQYDQGLIQLTPEVRDNLLSIANETSTEHQLALYEAALQIGKLDLRSLGSRVSGVSYRPLQLVLDALGSPPGLGDIPSALRAVMGLRAAALANCWFSEHDVSDMHTLREVEWELDQLRAQRRAAVHSSELTGPAGEQEEWRLRVSEFELIYSLHCPPDMELSAAVGENPRQLMVDAVAAYHNASEPATSPAYAEVQIAVAGLEAWTRLLEVMQDHHVKAERAAAAAAGDFESIQPISDETDNSNWFSWVSAWMRRDRALFLEVEQATRTGQWHQIQELQEQVSLSQLALLEPFDAKRRTTTVRELPISARYLILTTQRVTEVQGLLQLREVVSLLQTFSHGDLWAVLNRVGDLLAHNKPSITTDQVAATQLAIRLRVVHEFSASLEEQRGVVEEVLHRHNSADASSATAGFARLILQTAKRELRMAEKRSCLQDIESRARIVLSESKDANITDKLGALGQLASDAYSYSDLFSAEEKQLVDSVSQLVALKLAVCNKDWQAVDTWHDTHAASQIVEFLRNDLDQIQDDAANARATDNLLTLLETHKLKSLPAILKLADDPQSQLAYDVGLGDIGTAAAHKPIPSRRQSFIGARFADGKNFSVDIADLAARIVSATSVTHPTQDLQNLINSSQAALTLRRAIHAADWTMVAQLVRECKVATLHPLVESEIELAELALEYRSAVQNLSDALSRGGPRNSLGSVDATNVRTAELEEAVEIARNLPIKEPILHRLCLIAEMVVQLRKAVRDGRWLEVSSGSRLKTHNSLNSVHSAVGESNQGAPSSASATCIALRSAIISGSLGRGEQLFVETVQKIDASAIPEFRARSLDAAETVESILTRIRQLDGLPSREAENQVIDGELSASNYPPIVQDEICLVEQELEGRYLKSILVPPLQHFQPSHDWTSATAVSELTARSDEPVISSRSPHFAGHSSITSLRDALDHLRSYVPITPDGRVLLHTARLVLMAREALAAKDWQAFEAALLDISKAQDIRAFTPNICDLELNTYRSNTLRCALLERELVAVLAEQRVQGSYYDLKLPTTQVLLVQWLDTAKQLPATGAAFRNLELLITEAQCVLDARMGLLKANNTEQVEAALKQYLELFTVNDARPSWSEMSLIKAHLEYRNLVASLMRSLRYNCLARSTHRPTNHQFTSLELCTESAMDFIFAQQGFRFDPWKQNLAALEGPQELFKAIASSLTVQPIIQCLSAQGMDEMAISDWILSAHSRPADVVLARLLSRMASDVARSRFYNVHQQMAKRRDSLTKPSARVSEQRANGEPFPRRRSSASETTRRRHSLIGASRSDSFTGLTPARTGSGTPAPPTASRRNSLMSAHTRTETAARDVPKLADLPAYLARADEHFLIHEAAVYIEFVKNEFVNHILRSQLLEPLCAVSGSYITDSKRTQLFESAHQAVRNVERVVQDAESIGKTFSFEPEVLHLAEIWRCMNKLREAALAGRFDELDLWVTTLSEQGALFEAQAQTSLSSPTEGSADLRKQRAGASHAVQLELSLYRHMKEEHSIALHLASTAEAIHSSASANVEARIHSLLHRVERLGTLHPRIQQLLVFCDGLLRLLQASNVADIARSAKLSHTLVAMPIRDGPSHPNAHIHALCEQAVKGMSEWLRSFHHRWTTQMSGRRRSSLTASLVGMVNAPIKRTVEPLFPTSDTAASPTPSRQSEQFVIILLDTINAATRVTTTHRRIESEALATIAARVQEFEVDMQSTQAYALVYLVGRLILLSVTQPQPEQQPEQQQGQQQGQHVHSADQQAQSSTYLIPEVVASCVISFLPPTGLFDDSDMLDGCWLALACSLLIVIPTTVLPLASDHHRHAEMNETGSEQPVDESTVAHSPRDTEGPKEDDELLQAQKSLEAEIQELLGEVQSWLHPRHFQRIAPIQARHASHAGQPQASATRTAILNRKKNFQVVQL